MKDMKDSTYAHYKKQSGFISVIILIIVGLIILELVFHVDIIKILQSPQIKKFDADIIQASSSAYQWFVKFLK